MCVNPTEKVKLKKLFKVLNQDETVQIGKHGNFAQVPTAVLTCSCGTCPRKKMPEQTFVILLLIWNLDENLFRSGNGEEHYGSFGNR